MEKTEKITGVVVKKGRKYFQVKLDKTKNDYLHKVAINDVSKSWKVGDRFSVSAIPKWDVSYNTQKWYISLYTPVSEEAINSAEIDRWMGYVKEAFRKGYIYTKGVDKLRELGATKELAEVQELKVELTYRKTLEKFVDYLTLYNKFLSDEWDKIHKSGRKEDIQKAEKVYNEYLEKKNAEKAEKQKKEEERKALGYQDGIILDDRFVYQHCLHEGSYYEKNGRIYKVLKLSNRKSAEREYGGDAMSFGILSDYFYKANVRDVTDLDDKEVHEYKQYLEDKKKLAELSTLYQKKENTLKKAIARNAKLKCGTKWVDIHPQETVDLKNTRDIYGHGEYLFVSNGRIYWVICNHADGDFWDVNTVDGWGYGYSLKATDANMKLVDAYEKAKDNYLTLKNKIEKSGL